MSKDKVETIIGNIRKLAGFGQSGIWDQRTGTYMTQDSKWNWNVDFENIEGFQVTIRTALDRAGRPNSDASQYSYGPAATSSKSKLVPFLRMLSSVKPVNKKFHSDKEIAATLHEYHKEQFKNNGWYDDPRFRFFLPPTYDELEKKVYGPNSSVSRFRCRATRQGAPKCGKYHLTDLPSHWLQYPSIRAMLGLEYKESDPTGDIFVQEYATQPRNTRWV